MSQKRKLRPCPAVVPSQPKAQPPAEPTVTGSTNEARPVRFWQVLGGAAVAVVAFIGVAVAQHLYGQVKSMQGELSTLSSDLRKDLGKMGESHTGMIKKEDYDNRLRIVWETVRELRSDRADLSTLKERCTRMLELLETSEVDRRNLLAEVRRLRESRATDEERKHLQHEIRTLRERIAGLTVGKRTGVEPASHAGDRPAE